MNPKYIPFILYILGSLFFLVGSTVSVWQIFKSEQKMTYPKIDDRRSTFIQAYGQ